MSGGTKHTQKRKLYFGDRLEKQRCRNTQRGEPGILGNRGCRLYSWSPGFGSRVLILVQGLDLVEKGYVTKQLQSIKATGAAKTEIGLPHLGFMV